MTKFFNYHQPSFYHFSQASIHLANQAVSLSSHKKEISLMDLCAGSGVVGLEYFLNHPHMNQIKRVAFCDVQEECCEVIKKNIDNLEMLSPLFRAVEKNIYPLPMSQLKTDPSLQEQFNILVCNPPFYHREKGKNPLNKNRAISHFYYYDSRDELYRVIYHLLQQQGEAFILGRTPVQKNEIPKGFKIINEIKIDSQTMMTQLYKGQ